VWRQGHSGASVTCSRKGSGHDDQTDGHRPVSACFSPPHLGIVILLVECTFGKLGRRTSCLANGDRGRQRGAAQDGAVETQKIQPAEKRQGEAGGMRREWKAVALGKRRHSKHRISRVAPTASGDTERPDHKPIQTSGLETYQAESSRKGHKHRCSTPPLTSW